MPHASSLPFDGYAAVTLRLTASERDIVTRPIVGDGGHQRLLVEIRQRLDGETLTLDGRVLDRVARYAYQYRDGGYQVRFRALVAAARRAGWTEP